MEAKREGRLEAEAVNRETSNNSNNDSFEQVLARRFARRNFIKGAAVSTGALVLNPSALAGRGRRGRDRDDGPRPLTFQPLQVANLDTVTVAEGYESQVVIRWGDPLFRWAPQFDVDNQTPQAQALQFGFNCDFVGFFPLPAPHFDSRKRRATKGLLVVNHEYTDGNTMFRDYVAGQPSRQQVDIELAAHGLTVVEIEYKRHSTGQSARGWNYKFSRYNRRLTAESEFLLTGPAAGHDLLKTSSDPTGRRVRGSLNNCAAGKTPWGTVLTCEENFNQYFANNGLLADGDPRKAIHARYGLTLGASERRWENFHDRFDISKEPNEPFRFGWVIEVDPFDPDSTPRKLTALGRMKHEAATVVISKRGHAVVYTGDDERFDYLYKFVSEKRFRGGSCADNRGLLDSGVLYVAKFNDDGSGQWIPLVAGQGALAGWTQAEILINTRGAADQLGATKMDRPEDIETNPVNGKLYCVMTNNTQRGGTGRPGIDAANPRANNRHGHIIELTEGHGDPASTTFEWEIFLLCGDPNNPADGTFFGGFEGSVSSVSCPDNINFDAQGNLWIATDGAPGTLAKNDGIYAVPVEGPDRGWLRQFMSGPLASEICGPEFTPDNLTLFCAIQHPGEGGRVNIPVSVWPDGVSPARPSVIAIFNGDDEVIGA
ncbi:MAG TPA: PhoX family phosphatase [Blastocatellia bacterium]|nr:PhoX family phosphatase [Blastocatellia bacterium]